MPSRKPRKRKKRMPPPSKRLPRKETLPLITAPPPTRSAQPVVVPRSRARRALGDAELPMTDVPASTLAADGRADAVTDSVDGSAAMTALGARGLSWPRGDREQPWRSRPSSLLVRLGCDCGRALMALGWRITAPP